MKLVCDALSFLGTALGIISFIFDNRFNIYQRIVIAILLFAFAFSIQLYKKIEKKVIIVTTFMIVGIVCYLYLFAFHQDNTFLIEKFHTGQSVKDISQFEKIKIWDVDKEIDDYGVHLYNCNRSYIEGIKGESDYAIFSDERGLVMAFWTKIENDELKCEEYYSILKNGFYDRFGDSVTIVSNKESEQSSYPSFVWYDKDGNSVFLDFNEDMHELYVSWMSKYGPSLNGETLSDLIK